MRAGDSTGGAWRVAGKSVLRSHTSRTPPSAAPPRSWRLPGGAGLRELRWLQSASRAPAALLLQPGRGWHRASAGRARGSEPSPGRGPRRGRRPGCSVLGALLGAPSRTGGAPGTGLRSRRAREGYTFPSAPLVSSCGAAAEISSRGNYADPSRGSSPRPSSPPPSPWLGSWCWPAPGSRLWQPGPGGGGGPRSRWPLTRSAM